MNHRPTPPLDTLRLPLRERQRVVAAMTNTPRPSDQERRRARVAYNIGEAIIVMGGDANSGTRFSVAPRNLSAGGMSFLHGQFIHADSPCHCLLPVRGGKRVAVPGTTTRCAHVKGLIHEVSVCFDKPIELGDFLGSGAVVDSRRCPDRRKQRRESPPRA
jgi:hypothetical protein